MSKVDKATGEAIFTECRICHKKKLTIMLDNNGVCLWCKRYADDTKTQEQIHEDIQKKRNYTLIVNIFTSSLFTDEELETIINDAKEMREEYKRQGDSK